MYQNRQISLKYAILTDFGAKYVLNEMNSIF